MSSKSTPPVIYNDPEDTCSLCSSNGDREDCRHALLAPDSIVVGHSSRERNGIQDFSMSDVSSNQGKINRTKISQINVGKKCITGSVVLLCIVILVGVVASYKSNNTIIKGSEYYIGNEILDPSTNIITPEEISMYLVNTSDRTPVSSTSSLSEIYQRITIPSISNTSELEGTSIPISSTINSLPSTSTVTAHITSTPSVSIGNSVSSTSTSSLSETYEGTSILHISTNTSILSTSTISLSERYNETSMNPASTKNSISISNGSSSSEPYEGTSIPSVGTKNSMTSTSDSSSLNQTDTYKSNNEKLTKEETEMLFNLTIGKLINDLPCQPRPMKESVKKYLKSDNPIHDKDLYPGVVVVMRCDNKNSYCGNEVGSGDSNKVCISTQNVTTTHAFKYPDNNGILVIGTIVVRNETQCACAKV